MTGIEFLNAPGRHPLDNAMNEVVVEVFRLNGALIASGDTLTKDLNLTSARWQVLGAIFLSPVPLPVAHIARNMGLIEAHLANDGGGQEPLSVAALANAARLSINHFIRSFTADKGETPHQHLLRRRVERAMGHLASRDCSVGEVCDLAGFAGAAHFVSVFRKHTGVTPGAFRDALRR